MEYNGWKNYASWNVMLWIDNDYNTYQAAVEFMKDYKGKAPYKAFVADTGLSTQRTPDRVKWLGEGLDYKSLNDAMWEMAPEGARKLK